MLKYLKNVATLKLDTQKCVGCGTCLAVCPHEVFVLEGRKARITDLDACMECGACARNCPVACIAGERKSKHVIDQSKCIKCGVCYQTCKFHAIDRN